MVMSVTPYLYIGYHPIKIQANCFWVIVSVFRPGNSSIIENILVITYKDDSSTMRNQYSWHKSPKQGEYSPHVGDDIKTFAPGKYRSIRAAASRREPVPERPWTVATCKEGRK